MDEFERRVADRLTTAFSDTEPPPSLGPAILRRATRRRRAAYAAAGTATALALTPLVFLQGANTPSASTPGSTPQPTATKVTDLVDTGGVIRISGAWFLPQTLGEDGTVLGTDADTTGVWSVTPAGPAPAKVASVSKANAAYLWSMAVGERGYLWPNGERLSCLGPRGQGPVRTFRDGWGGRELFFVDGATFIWSDEGKRLVLADSCGGPTRTLAVRGTLMAFSFPHAFVRTKTEFKQVDIRDGTSSVHMAPPAEAVVAATPPRLAWAARNTLTLLDRGTGVGHTHVGVPKNTDPDYTGRLTAGDRLVVYTAVHNADGDLSTSMAYDSKTGKAVTFPGQAWTAGRWLLWQEGGAYRLARVRA